MSVYVLALLIGVVAGLRTMTAPAVVSWAAYLGRMHLEIRSALALAELVTDQLPRTPSRKVPMLVRGLLPEGFAARRSGRQAGHGSLASWLAS